MPNESDLKAVTTVTKRNGGHWHADMSRQNGNPSNAGHLFGISFANIKLLLISPAVAGILVFAVVSLLPRSYTSVSYLNLDEAGARAAEARIRSIPVIDRVLSQHEAPRQSAEARRGYIHQNLRIMVAPGELSRKDPHLYRMEYSDSSPSIARTIHQQLLEAWLESTRPGADERAATDAEIQRLAAQATAAQPLIEDLASDMRDPSLRKARASLAEMMLRLSARQNETLARLAALRSSRNGLSREVVIGEPTLPAESSWPNTAIIVILTVAATSLLLPIFLIAWSFLRACARNTGRKAANGSAFNP